MPVMCISVASAQGAKMQFTTNSMLRTPKSTIATTLDYAISQAHNLLITCTCAWSPHCGQIMQLRYKHQSRMLFAGEWRRVGRAIIGFTFTFLLWAFWSTKQSLLLNWCLWDYGNVKSVELRFWSPLHRGTCWEKVVNPSHCQANHVSPCYVSVSRIDFHQSLYVDHREHWFYAACNAGIVLEQSIVVMNMRL